ncbi:hypothetical protein DFO73_10111 [Cytobacillus oceanisediminis]|jgi:hypothetical protein|uniref:Uncharacterized protein n=1 Tax=Cytobacillus oceanisediminis TaxID=665099 RepID=A0A2V3A5D3_9BACI|nr:hypothetical protein DFO73_10111 [Cytobacillus oceanisediminis]
MCGEEVLCAEKPGYEQKNEDITGSLAIKKD